MSKQQYQVRNWKEYNKALVSRGSLTFWFDTQAIEHWHAQSVGKRGRPQVYSDMAIQCALILKVVFHLPLRATQGLLRSLIELSGLAIPTPDYSTLSRRQPKLEVALKSNVIAPQEDIQLVVDATGLKVYGEGEWKVRMHGIDKRRTWRKLHIAVNPASHTIEAAVVTTNDFKDSELMEELLEQIEQPISDIFGDGAYDTHQVFQAITHLGANPVIPPRVDAVIKQHGNCKEEPFARDNIIRHIREKGRKAWKKDSQYFTRNLAETAMFRIKQLFGSALSARNFENQATEALLKCLAINKMTSLGMPDSVMVN